MDDLISKLSEIRSRFNCFDDDEAPFYRALSEAIRILSKRADGDAIGRAEAIDAVETKIKKWNAVDSEGYHVGLGLRYTDVIDTLTELPSAQPQDIAQDIARIIENEKDMRVIAKNAQPEIIRCKDCRYSIDEYGDGECYCKRPSRELVWIGKRWDFFCAAARLKMEVEHE